MVLDETTAIEEAKKVTAIASGQKTCRIPGLTDAAVIAEHFGTRAIPYDYKVGDRRYQGVIVPEPLARNYFLR